MNKKNEKHLCWNCSGNISLHLVQCPYCGVDVTQPISVGQTEQEFASPFQRAPEPRTIPKPPFQSLEVSQEEWQQALEEEHSEEEVISPLSKREMIALLLLLPGIVFLLFGLTLLLFSKDGHLTVEWSQNLAYFYFLGALPLLYLGWRAFK